MRKIIHIDMDAFFASIEQREHPEYKGQPLAVGYSGERGVVASASYEARKYGVKSAMSSKIALRKCPNLIFVSSSFDLYKSVSNEIMNIFHEYTDLVEPLSLDEAFLDVTSNHKNMEYATDIAIEIRDKIFKKTGLTASAGISFNKFLAKIASDYNKPNGQYIIKPQNAEKFVENLSIERFFGVGKVTAKRMHSIGIKNGYDLKQKTKLELSHYFGKAGLIYYEYARAIDNRPVIVDRERKSIGAESTFSHDIDSLNELLIELKDIAQDVTERIKKKKFHGRTITLKVKYSDFRNISRSKTTNFNIEEYPDIYNMGTELLNQIDISPKVRLLGLSVKNNIAENVPMEAIQLSINFDDHEK